MKLFTKIFLFGMLAFGAAFSVSGYFLLHYSMEGSISREVDFALRQYQYDKFTIQSASLTQSGVTIITNPKIELSDEEDVNTAIWKAFPYGTDYAEGFFIPYGQPASPELSADLFRSLSEELSVPAGFFAEDKSTLYSELKDPDLSFLDTLSENNHTYRFQSSPEGGCILVGSILCWNEWEEFYLSKSPGAEAKQTDFAVSSGSSQESKRIYFVTQWDISKTIHQQHVLRQYFIRCYLTAMAAGTVLLGILSALFTGPLKKMSKAAGRMAEGCYEERLETARRDEMGALAESFNQMAAAVEEKIAELSKNARAKEDFAANFAHELKTPLTSIIGYADTIYQKELSREEIRQASWHIWNEGMRLEALSLKLMELTVLARQDFLLSEIPAEELLADAAESFSPILQNSQTTIRLQTVSAYVMADYDLLKTLLINLIDNSVKAGSSGITLTGELCGEKYLVCIKDDGCGMDPEELSRITEAFYMVDKARSRKQHGAGLGLALSQRIAEIHGSTLTFESRKGAGTSVSFLLNRDIENKACLPKI